MFWKVEYVLLILFSTAIDYYSGLQMGKHAEKEKRKKYLVLSISANLGLLFFFKYFNFLSENIGILFSKFHMSYESPVLGILLPVGISFYTFQTMSYSIDVYRGVRKPEKHFGLFALYVSFFPQLVAGPIERSTRLLPQFHKIRDFDNQSVVVGLQWILWGFFKKIVIADRVGFYVNEVFNNPANYQSPHLILAVYFFAFQIYCDFSGYSDIAVGCSKILGFDLMKNFNHPYCAKSLRDFWQRWHISLSSWFKDYLYISLGGNRVTLFRWQANLLITFLLSGLWHGANWNFLLWGGYHGTLIILSYWLHLFFNNWHKNALNVVSQSFLSFIRVFFTFHLVSLSWIIFRANSLSEAFYIIKHLFVWTDVRNFHLALPGFTNYDIALSLIFILILEGVQFLQRNNLLNKWLYHPSRWIRWSIYYVMIFILFLFGVFDSQQFIYFQF